MPEEKFVLIVSGPSGVGKTTLCNFFLEQHKNFVHPISVTTRTPREYEINGVHYNFISCKQYEDMLANNELLETVAIYGNHYGTQAKLARYQLRQHNLVFNIDNSGMKKVKKFFINKARIATIFILPPSIDALRERIERRGDKDGKIEERNNKAFTEIETAKEYDYIIMNDDLEKAKKQLTSIYEVLYLKAQRKYLARLFVSGK